MSDLSKPGSEIVASEHWPLEERERPWWRATEPLEGFVLEPGQIVSVLINGVVAEDGPWFYESTTVKYQQDGQSVTLTAPKGFQICPTEEDCPKALQ